MTDLLLRNWRERTGIEPLTLDAETTTGWPDYVVDSRHTAYRLMRPFRQFGLKMADLFFQRMNTRLKRVIGRAVQDNDWILLRALPSPVLAHVGRSVPAHGYASWLRVTPSVTTGYGSA